jgi:hypothetical protein
MSLTSRRSFLKGVGAAGIAGAAHLWLPKIARAAGPAGTIKRVIMIMCGGGVNWANTFDAAASSPWGIANWGALGATGSAPEWGFGRLLMQKPIIETSTDWNAATTYLRSDTNYNLKRSVLASWGGATTPTIADVAREIAVVRVSNNPGLTPNLDHGQAGSFLFTNSLGVGEAGMATVLYHALKQQMGANFDAYYKLPAVAFDQGLGFAIGAGTYAGSRPMLLQGALSLPSRDPNASVSKWGRASETQLNQAFAQNRPSFTSDRVADLISDSSTSERYGAPLLSPVLHIDTQPTEALGTRFGTSTPVTNAMLRELFAINSSETPAGDFYFDLASSHQKSTWTNDQVAYSAAFAVRLLQMGAPIVAMGASDLLCDHHSGMVFGDTRGSHGYHLGRIARTLGALEFALKNISDPSDPAKNLWDGAVVFVCSEFGRPASFNIVSGANGGGTDHDGANAFVVMGGPVVAAGAGGKLLRDSANGGFFHQTRFFTSLLAGMGTKPADSTYLAFADLPPIPGLFPGV